MRKLIMAASDGKRQPLENGLDSNTREANYSQPPKIEAGYIELRELPSLGSRSAHLLIVQRRLSVGSRHLFVAIGGLLIFTHRTAKRKLWRYLPSWNPWVLLKFYFYRFPDLWTRYFQLEHTTLFEMMPYDLACGWPAADLYLIATYYSQGRETFVMKPLLRPHYQCN
ncbi:hypothetical protein BJ912DRAFT_503906 [Pholiota molesta]|nr:hypothetical protein BJ912DRAFT_503906 [Pholiota molesta]